MVIANGLDGAGVMWMSSASMWAGLPEGRDPKPSREGTLAIPPEGGGEPRSPCEEDGWLRLGLLTGAVLASNDVAAWVMVVATSSEESPMRLVGVRYAFQRGQEWSRAVWP